MVDLSTKTILVHDLSGGFTHIAEAMVPAFGNVMYYSFYEHSFPNVKDYLPGVGLDGIERVEDFDDALPRADMVCFTDVGRPGLQERLRKEGVPVCGAGRGCRLEQDRIALKTVLKECGLPVGPWYLVKGIDALREIVQEKEDLWIKLSMWRACLDTFHHEKYFKTQTWLNDLGVRLGPFGAEAQFIVEEPIKDAVEVGIDGFLVGGQLVGPTLWGYENKDKSYLGTITRMPDRLMECYTKLQPVLEAINYSGPFCLESRITAEEAFIIDWTSRFGSPPSEAQVVMIENLPEIVWETAHGRMVKAVYRSPYVAQLVLGSEWGSEHPLGLEIGRPESVCIHGHCRFGGQDFAVSPAGIKECGGAVGLGNSLEEAILDALDAADSVSGYELGYDQGAFTDACEAICEGETLDLPWGRVVGEEKAA